MNMHSDNASRRTASIDAKHEATSADDERGFHLDLERYWLEARAVRYWLLGIVALVLVAGLIVTLLMTPLFRANSRIEVSQITVNVTAIDTMKNDSRASTMQYLNTQYELLASRFMAARVADAANLLRDEAFMDAAGLDPSQGLTEADIQDALLAGITITPIEQSSLVDIGYSSSSSEVSAKIANLWADEFIKANYEKRFGANIEARDFLSKQIAELRERLASS